MVCARRLLFQLWPLLFFLLLILNGCAARQDQGPVVTVPASPPPQAGDPTLTRAEMAVLHSTGQLDGNVPADAMKDVAQEYKHYLRKGRGTVCAFSKRSEQYLAYARQIFREKGMPEELANLAIVESGYRPEAVSRAGAAGAWQFMPGTGQKYGLVQDWWQDERFDPYKATEAAADYLQKLYNDFGDWPTAIAAYNAGEGKMSRAKEGTGGKDFFEVTARNHMLDDKAQLREETRQYVPRFLAVSKIMRNLPQLGFDPIRPEDAEGVARLTAAPGTDLKALSRACNMGWNDFAAYNQHHKRAITCTDRETFVYVPKSAAAQASSFLCSGQTASFAGWKPVRVASGKDSLANISKRAHISLEKLQVANPGLERLKAGQIILAPPTVDMAPKAVEALYARAAQKMIKGKIVSSDTGKGKTGAHAIQPGDTLYSVAKKYNVDVGALMAQNGLSDPGRLKRGQLLKIPARAAQGGSRGSIGKRSPTYKVQAKDNLWSIARRHNVSVEDLKRWNKVTEKSLKAGVTLIVAEE